MSEHIEVLVTKEDVEKRISEMADEINRAYAGKSLHLVCVLKGGAFFMCELAKHLNMPVSLDFMSVSSYGSATKSSGVVKIVKDLDEPIKDKDVLVVEDIVDTGNTIVDLAGIVKEKGALDCKICTMLLKPEVYKKDVKLDYVAMEIPNKFIVGFGLDYNELGRNYKDIYVLDED